MKKIYSLIIAFSFISTSFLFAQAVVEIKVGQGGGLTYSPKNVTCNVDDTIKFTWVTGTHPTVSDDGTTIPQFNMSSTSTSKKIVMTATGVIPYYCVAHGGPGGAGMSGTITVSTPTGLSKSPSLTNSLQVYPNPASEKVTVSFNMKKEGTINIKLIDVLGNEVATLVNEKVSSGEYKQQLNIPSRVSTGLYFVKISSGSEVAMKRISIE